MTKVEWYAPLVDERGNRLRCVKCRARATHRHHVVYEQHVRREKGDPWDVRNSIPLCVPCHNRHHNAFERIPMVLIPNEALEFAIELMGTARSAMYFARYYRQPTQKEA